MVSSGYLGVEMVETQNHADLESCRRQASVVCLWGSFQARLTEVRRFTLNMEEAPILEAGVLP